MWAAVAADLTQPPSAVTLAETTLRGDEGAKQNNFQKLSGFTSP